MQRIYLDCYKNTIEISVKLAASDEQVVDFYFYIPQELGLKPQDYQLSDFYRNMTSHLFYHIKTPTASILEGEAIAELNEQNLALYVKSFKIFVRGAVKDATPEVIAPLFETTDRILNDFRAIMDKYPELSKKIKIADEVCAYYYEQSVLAFLTQYPTAQAARLKASQLKSYRNEKYGIKSDFAADLSFIKKKEEFISEPIKIHGTRKKLGVWREQFVFSLSAFLSMLLTTLIVFSVQKGAGSLSFNLFVAMCISYIFKDRFKELFRNYVLKRMNKGKDQFQSHLKDFKKNEIGFVKEQVQFCKPAEEIDNLRRVGRFLKRELHEDVLHYRKYYHVYRNKFSGGFNVLRDLFHIHVDEIIRNAPEQHVKYFAMDDKGLVSEHYVQARYDLNLVIKTNNQLYRYRLKISSDGIESPELVTEAQASEIPSIIKENQPMTHEQEIHSDESVLEEITAVIVDDKQVDEKQADDRQFDGKQEKSA